MMQSPDELTVSEFERNEYFWSVLPVAIEDMQELLDFCDRIDFDEAAEMKLRAARVFRLLEDAREREAGRLA